MFATSAALLLPCTFMPIAAHMSMVLPQPRNAVDRFDPRWKANMWYPYVQNCSDSERLPDWNPQTPSGCVPKGTDGWGCNCFNGTGQPCDVGQSCLWFSQGCSIGCKTCDGLPSNPNTKDRCASGMKATINDPRLRTYNRKAKAGSDADIYKHNPWRAPGFAPVFDSCGMAGGGPTMEGGEGKYTQTKFAKQGDLGSSVLSKSPTGIIWKAGSVVTAKWSVRANHGGGYQWRICPASEKLTEDCFMQTPLPFAVSTQTLELVDGVVEINGTYVSEGTNPKGSTWAMNPLPYSNPESPPEFDPPCHEYVDHTKGDTGRCSGRDPFNTLIVDKLLVPENLATGDYVVSLRWDCEKSAQVWTNCADIFIEGNVLV